MGHFKEKAFKNQEFSLKKFNFYLLSRLTDRPYSVMREKKTDEFYIFDVESISPYKTN